MRSSKTENTIQLEEDIEFERAEWRAQRIGWVVMAVIVVAALAGALGQGPLSRAQVGSPEIGLVINYHRIARYHAPTAIEFRLIAPETDEAHLSIDRDYLDGLDIESVVPEPARVASAAGKLVYTFDLSREQSTLPHKVVFQVRPTKSGVRHASAGVSGKSTVAFDQFILP